MRSPLGVITGALRQDDADLDPAIRARMLDIAARAATKIEYLADRLALAGRLQSDAAPSMVACELAELVRAAVTRIETLRARRGVTVDVGEPPDDVRVIGDPPLLTAAVSELVDNALRFAKTRVRVDVQLDEGHACVRVEDDGAHLDATQVEAGWTRDQPLSDRSGLGIGLWLATTIAQHHGGRVTLHADSPTVFVLTLPRP